MLLAVGCACMHMHQSHIVSITRTYCSTGQSVIYDWFEATREILTAAKPDVTNDDSVERPSDALSDDNPQQGLQVCQPERLHLSNSVLFR